MVETARGAGVLIVDDEPSIVETVRFALEQAGYTCFVAYDGEEAMQVIRTENPALILLDIMLPKLNGFQVCRLLKFDERYRQIPVIMLTARAQERDRLLGKETGADAYVTKPFDLPELLRVVERYLPPPAAGSENRK